MTNTSSLNFISPLAMISSTIGNVHQRLIDRNAIDIMSLKGQFAWEKIPQSDIYMPVIFRGDTKYFCIRMLHKLLPDYPEDFIRRSYQYQYQKPIDMYPVTAYEVELLNRINAQHSRWAYSRQPFTALDEIVRVSDFLPFYEHLRHLRKSIANSSNNPLLSLRQLLPRSSDFTINMPTILRPQSNISQGTSLEMQRYPPPTDLSRETTSTILRPNIPTLNTTRPQRPSKPIPTTSAVILPPQLIVTQQQQTQPLQLLQPLQPSQPTPPASKPPQQPVQLQQPPPLLQVLKPLVPNNMNNSTSIVPTSNTSTILNTTPASLISSSDSSSSSPVVLRPHPSTSHTYVSPMSISSTLTSRPTTVPDRKPIKTSPSSISSAKLSRLHCGWLQINKLYTPYVSTSSTNHHLYKVPVNLLSFYDLLKTPNETGESKDGLKPFEYTLATQQELDLINDLCKRQNIKAFEIDTKLIQLSKFYEYSSANILFLKELPSIEPKASICKDWSTIVKINGGICRLRNITSLNEQTVPFIGTNLLKIFTLSSQCISSATLTKPTSSEIEFLQLILFYSNISINLRNAQLIDIESVRKEYSVDLILLFNDKFPLNVLNYQQQGNTQSNNSQRAIVPENPTATINTIAESTPPPSPPSPANNLSEASNTSQLPLISSANRYYKTVEFHGQSVTAYICSGLGSNTQRECLSVKSLCNILYPNSTIMDKLEAKMLRILRSKNINRFRPHNQQSIGYTRLVDIKDAEKHWDYIKQTMHLMLNDDEEIKSQLKINDDTNIKPVDNSMDTENRLSSESSSNTQNRGEKRTINDQLDGADDTPVNDRINKRVRFTDSETSEQLIKTINNEENSDRTNENSQLNINQKSKRKVRLLPSARPNRGTLSSWTKKYDIQDCCIQLTKYDPTYDTGED